MGTTLSPQIAYASSFRKQMRERTLAAFDTAAVDQEGWLPKDISTWRLAPTMDGDRTHAVACGVGNLGGRRGRASSSSGTPGPNQCRACGRGT
eukprot:15431591-Alexandrium_andersonii.AAC.2